MECSTGWRVCEISQPKRRHYDAKITSQMRKVSQIHPFIRTMSFRKDSDVVVRCAMLIVSRNYFNPIFTDMDTSRKEINVCLRRNFQPSTVRCGAQKSRLYDGIISIMTF